MMRIPFGIQLTKKIQQVRDANIQCYILQNPEKFTKSVHPIEKAPA